MIQWIVIGLYLWISSNIIHVCMIYIGIQQRKKMRQGEHLSTTLTNSDDEKQKNRLTLRLLKEFLSVLANWYCNFRNPDFISSVQFFFRSLSSSILERIQPFEFLTSHRISHYFQRTPTQRQAHQFFLSFDFMNVSLCRNSESATYFALREGP